MDQKSLIRQARPDDIWGILAVNEAAGVDGLTVERFSQAVTDPSRCVVVAEVAGDVVAWAKTHYFAAADGVAPAGEYLGGITVAPSWRRRGFGAALTQIRLDWIWARTRHAYYITNVGNVASLELHKEWGFRELARGRAFQGTTFDGGVGVLLVARGPEFE